MRSTRLYRQTGPGGAFFFFFLSLLTLQKVRRCSDEKTKFEFILAWLRYRRTRLGSCLLKPCISSIVAQAPQPIAASDAFLDRSVIQEIDFPMGAALRILKCASGFPYTQLPPGPLRDFHGLRRLSQRRLEQGGTIGAWYLNPRRSWSMATERAVCLYHPD